MWNRYSFLPIVRESDGLAMSSRNVYLSEEERVSAGLLSRALDEGRTLIEKGCHNPEDLRQHINKLLQSDPKLQVQYIEIVHPSSLKPLESLKKPVMIALAVHIGKTRLIDNIIIEE